MKNNYLLGFSKVDITPKKNVQTVGFNRKDNLSKGVLHKLFAQITIWKNGYEKYCLITIDHIGFSRKEANELRKDIAKELNISTDEVMLCFSHTHSSPNISIEKEYKSYLYNKIIMGLDEAEKKYFPIKAAWGYLETDIGVNRRNENGELDKRIGILKIVNSETEELKLLLLRVTAHANVLDRNNFFISSDFIGVTRDHLEKKYECDVMITQGAAGNVKPKFSGSEEALQKMANIIIEDVSTSIDDIKPKKVEKLSIVSHKEAFYADVPSIQKAKEIANNALKESNINGDNWLNEIIKLNKLNVKTQKDDIEIQFFIVNEGCYCGVPNEIMCELSLDVLEKSQNKLIYFGGYTNGCEGYLPTASEYDKGGYEVLYSYLIYYIYHETVMPLNRETASKLTKKVVEKWEELQKNY